MRTGARRQRFGGRWGLTARLAMASALLSLLIGGVFTYLIMAVISMRDTATLARHSERTLAAAYDLERVVVDLETGERGYLLTRDEAFLGPWKIARARFEPQAAQLRELSGGYPSQQERAKRITRDGRAYLTQYSEPLIRDARRDPAAVATPARIAEEKRRVDTIRADFDDFVRFEQKRAADRVARSDDAARRAVLVAVCGTAGSVLLITGFSGHLTRQVVRPVRRVSRMAVAVARGDLTVRLRETGKAEIGHLEHSMNTMARSLERNRDELIASRARIAAAGDAARRRIERDLHDGTQQRLVALGLELRLAEDDVPPDQTTLRHRLAGLVTQTTDVVQELRELSRGIHPAILTKSGVVPAITALARRSPLPVETDLRVDRKLPERVEVAIYYVVSEALTNAAKHAHASYVRITLTATDREAHLTVSDDGIGGANPGRGSGLIGLRDRVEALGGRVEIKSPPAGGTTLSVCLPMR
ncbi:CHASE3 domain-containing protein [Actinoallomurus sp. CA-142502]|uniref:CHASE3 domain-containing protein n=1 Tax=Actinoallomurus sp. CA-142502 TaxID=3239885 RepID=UPI003D93BD92